MMALNTHQRVGSVMPTVAEKWGQAAIPHFITFDFLNSDLVLMHLKMLLNLLFSLSKEEHLEFEKASKDEFASHVHLNSFLRGISCTGRRGHSTFIPSSRSTPNLSWQFFC